MKPLYKPGQIVLIRGDKRRWMVPTFDYYKETKAKWDHIPLYSKMSPEQFAEMKMKYITNKCIDCTCKNGFDHDCTEYVLLKLDQLDLPTGEINTHVCEQKLKLAK